MKLDLEKTKQLMVIAPHCDDEVLGCGGVIQRALEKGIEVKVLIVTNGDGFRWAAIRNFRRPFLSSKKFKEFGELRQRESIKALVKLGLPMENIYFLSYPDRGLKALWQGYWHDEQGYLSLYTQAVISPYELTYTPERQYTGKNLVKDIEEILRRHQPDQLFISSTYDDHPDHWAVYNFVHYALAKIKLEGEDYSPRSYQYLVHRGNWPTGSSDKLTPPAKLSISCKPQSLS
jgi:LmbE family N-acetylglucosaminyl deacetylase